MYKIFSVGFLTLISFSTFLRASNDTLSDLVARQSQMEEELRELRGKLEEIEHATQNLAKTQTDHQKPLADASHPADHSPFPDKTKSPDALHTALEDDGNRVLVDPKEEGSVQEQYNHARDLVMHRKYPEALAMFNSLIQRNSSDTIVVDAHYWIGEIRFIQGQFEEAAIAYADSYQSLKKFQNVLKDPLQSKAPNALIQLARSFKKLGQTDKSKQILAQYKKIFGEKQTKTLEKQYERAHREIFPSGKTVERTQDTPPTQVTGKA